MEGSTDLAILRAFARILNHPVQVYLERPFVHYVTKPKSARDHFYGIREAKSDIVGFALFDHLDQSLANTVDLREYMWEKNEIENYLFNIDTLMAYSNDLPHETKLVHGPLFESGERERRVQAMQECIDDFILGAAKRDPSDLWWKTNKASESLDRIFKSFYSKLGLPNLMNKSDYHILVQYLSLDRIDNEVRSVLNLIFNVGKAAKPIQEET